MTTLTPAKVLRRSRNMTFVWQILGLLLIVGVWWLCTDVFKVKPQYVFPSPKDVWEEFYYGFWGSGPQDGKLLLSVGNSLRRVALGYVIAVGLGGIMGLLMSLWRPLRETFGAYLQGLQSVPSIAFVPFAILFLGLNERAVFFVVILEGFIPVALAVSGAVLNVPPAWRTAGRTLGATHFGLVTRVLLPAAVPNIVTGLRTAWSFSWRALIGAELLTSNLGLGRLLEIGRNTSNMALVMATIIIVGVIGALFDLLIRTLESRIRRDYGLEAGS
ncbi:ABC transporter permease [Deinococcus detaillensis]|uniref:ABC transporter permease n=1 Tax=Deinococcus detaillensis TaxID=2592048 RepID=A0A553V1V2_9DEIO|nr:ABC transporter permease [Deinococcus detaillensis]TSA86432.1 ABC transporter permease [Deinococcus detaillensis]